MNLRKALRIEQLRVGGPMHSWRRISEIICEEFPDEPQELKGNQMHGIDLCKAAMVILTRSVDLKDVSEDVRMQWDT